MTKILDKKPKEVLATLLETLAIIRPGIDKVKVARLVADVVHHSNGKGQPFVCPENQNLLDTWLASIANGAADYSVYEGIPYIAELWGCWVIYSRSALRSIQQPKSLPPAGIVQDIGTVDSVLDLGCGFGYTTAALRQIFPQADIVGTNIPGTLQAQVAERLACQYRFRLAADASQVERTDLIFASEYFEHIEAPIEHLEELLAKQPKALIVANAFGTKAVGHFDIYNVGEGTVLAKETSAIFSRTLRDAGYQKVKTSLWNNRPTYWRR